MNRREKQVQLRLDKISQVSSPSPKREQPTSQASSGRLIPFTSSNTSPSKKTTKPNPQQTQELDKLRQQIMDRKQRLNLWEEAFNQRQSNNNQIKVQVEVLAKGLARMSVHPDLARTWLRAVVRGRRGVLLWLLGWLRQLFSFIRVMLTQRHCYPH